MGILRKAQQKGPEAGVLVFDASCCPTSVNCNTFQIIVLRFL
jgi:hypothetical protein